MEVSVIVPIYNVAKYIERSARSLMSQTFEDVEFLFIDDATEDDSITILEDVLKEYPSRNTQIIHHEHNRGLTAARNTGLKKAAGKYILHFDSDDWCEPNMIEALYKKAESEGADIVICDATIYSNDGNTIYRVSEWTGNKKEDLQKYIISHWTVVWNMLVKKSLYVENGIYSPEHIAFTEDFHLSVRLCYKAGKIVNLHEPLYNYNRMNVSSITHQKNQKRINDGVAVFTEIIEYFRHNGCLKDYAKFLYWRLLWAKQDLLFDERRHKEYLDICPESHKYLLSSPYANWKLKIMAWMLTHHMGYSAKQMLNFWMTKNKEQ